MDKIIDSLLASGDSYAFREPVDWRSLGLHDYPLIIKRPMDLGTVKLRLEQGLYNEADEVAADVRLIWENCKTYNGGGVPRKLHRAADNLSKRFEARFAKLPAGGGLKLSKKGAVDAAGRKRANGANAAADLVPPTNDDRRKLTACLARARMEDVTAAIHEIDRRCPGALGLIGEAIEVDVDALDTWTFCAVERIVAPQAALRRASRGTARRARKKRPATKGGAKATATATGSTATGLAEGAGIIVDGHVSGGPKVRTNKKPKVEPP